MKGPDHYCEAERLMAIVTDGSGTAMDDADLLTMAQVHATLALTAANAVYVDDDEAEWKTAISDA